MYKCCATFSANLQLCQVADVEARQRLRSSSSSSLIVSCTRLSTVGDRAFPVAAARVWNSLPDLVTSAPSVAVFRSRLNTHLFNISYPSPLWLYSACAVTLSCFGHFSRSCLLTYLLTESRSILGITMVSKWSTATHCSCWMWRFAVLDRTWKTAGKQFTYSKEHFDIIPATRIINCTELMYMLNMDPISQIPSRPSVAKFRMMYKITG